MKLMKIILPLHKDEEQGWQSLQVKASARRILLVDLNNEKTREGFVPITTFRVSDRAG